MASKWRRRFKKLLALALRYGHDHIQRDTLRLHEYYQQRPVKLFFYVRRKERLGAPVQRPQRPRPRPLPRRPLPLPQNNDKAAAAQRIYWQHILVAWLVWGIISLVFAVAISYYLFCCGVRLFRQVGHCVEV